MNELLSIVLYLGVVLGIIGIVVLFTTLKKQPIPLSDESEDNFIEKVEEVTEEENLEVEVKEEELKKENDFKKERKVFDDIDISSFDEEDGEEEKRASENEEFDMHYFEPLKYDRNVPDVKEEESEDEEGINFEKRLNYLVKKQDKDGKKK